MLNEISFVTTGHTRKLTFHEQLPANAADWQVTVNNTRILFLQTMVTESSAYAAFVADNALAQNITVFYRRVKQARKVL